MGKPQRAENDGQISGPVHSVSYWSNDVEEAISSMEESGAILGIYDQGHDQPFLRIVIDRVRPLYVFPDGRVLLLFYANGYVDYEGRGSIHFVLAEGLALDDFTLSFVNSDQSNGKPFRYSLDPIFDNIASDDWASELLARWRLWKEENRGEVEAAERAVDGKAAEMIAYWKRGGQ